MRPEGLGTQPKRVASGVLALPLHRVAQQVKAVEVETLRVCFLPCCHGVSYLLLTVTLNDEGLKPISEVVRSEAAMPFVVREPNRSAASTDLLSSAISSRASWTEHSTFVRLRSLLTIMIPPAKGCGSGPFGSFATNG